MINVYAVLAGVLLAPIGGALGVLVTCGVLMLRGVSEREGKRGLTAFAVGFVPGLIAGYLLGAKAGAWVTNGGGGRWHEVVAGTLLAMPLALLMGLGAWILGVHWAEARGVPHAGGARASWSLVYVAIPVACVAVIGGYFLGTALAK